ncbi:MAG: glycosyltransferase, partial [Nevskiales bacterium]
MPIDAGDARRYYAAMHVDVVIPVYNEERDLSKSIHTLDEFLRGIATFKSSIIIADNASVDRTWQIAKELESKLPTVRAFHLDLTGRGRALKAVWSQSKADVVSYMDVD